MKKYNKHVINHSKLSNIIKNITNNKLCKHIKPNKFD